jgi:predicted nucleic-acid-binding protein
LASIDTNVLVRLLVADDTAQLGEIFDLISRTNRTGDFLFVPITVVLELEWVLRSRYEFSKPEIVSAYIARLGREELEFQHEAAIEFAIYHSRQSNADFADCLHLSLSELANHLPLLTFDRRVKPLAGMESLSGGWANAHAA